MIVKTSELTGAAMDWAVAYALNGKPEFFKAFGAAMLGSSITGAVLAGNIYPSTSWSQCGPLLDKYDIALNGGVTDGERTIYATLRAVAGNSPFATATGPTRLVAACRAIVQSQLGDEVDVPAELLG